MNIDIPRHVHRDQSSCLVETWEGLRQAESEGWRVNPNEPDKVYALESAAAPATVAAPDEPDVAEAEADDLASVSEDAPEPAQDGAGEAEPATDEAEADDKPKRKGGRPKKG